VNYPELQADILEIFQEAQETSIAKLRNRWGKIYLALVQADTYHKWHRRNKIDFGHKIARAKRAKTLAPVYRVASGGASWKTDRTQPLQVLICPGCGLPALEQREGLPAGRLIHIGRCQPDSSRSGQRVA